MQLKLSYFNTYKPSSHVHTHADPYVYTLYLMKKSLKKKNFRKAKHLKLKRETVWALS